MIIQYNLVFLALYWVTSLLICIMGGYNLRSRKLWNEAYRGTRSFLIGLPFSNLAMLTVPDWNHTFQLIPFILYICTFDLLVFVFHVILHKNKYLYRIVHHEHHITKYVCPFSATILNVGEHIIIGLVPTILPLFIFPLSFNAWSVANALIFIHGLFIHSNVKSPFEYLGCIGSREHSSHHIVPTSHFGFLFPWWDMIYGSLEYPVGVYRIALYISRAYVV